MRLTTVVAACALVGTSLAVATQAVAAPSDPGVVSYAVLGKGRSVTSSVRQWPGSRFYRTLPGVLGGPAGL